MTFFLVSEVDLQVPDKRLMRRQRSRSMSHLRGGVVAVHHPQAFMGDPMDTSSSSPDSQRGRRRHPPTSRLRHHSAPARRVRDRSQLHVSQNQI